MRRSLSVFLLALIAFSALVGGQAQRARAALNVFIDGRAVPSSLITLHGGRLYASVPLLEHYELVASRRTGNTVELKAGNGYVAAALGDSTGIVNGREAKLEAPLIVVDGSVFIPLRMLADVAGWRVFFDAGAGRLDLVSRRPASEMAESPGAEPSGDTALADGSETGLASEDEEDPFPDLIADGDLRAEDESWEAADGPHGSDGFDDSLTEEMAQRAAAWNFEQRRSSLEERRRRLQQRLAVDQGREAADDALQDVASDAEPTVSAERPISPEPGPVTRAGGSRESAVDDTASEPVFSVGVFDEVGALDEPAFEADGPRELAPVLPPEERPAFAGDRTAVYAVTVGRENGHQRVVIHADGPLDFESHLLAGPSRLVIDLPEAVWIGEPQRTVHPGPVVRRIRAGQYDADRTRIVVDVDSPVRFQPEFTDDGLVLTLHQQVGPVRVWSGPTGPVIDISSSGPLEPVISTLPDPDRLVVDLPRASLVTVAAEGEGPGPGIGRWRVSQFDPDTVRLVVELDRPLIVRTSQFHEADLDAPGGAGGPGYAGVHRLALGSTMKGIGMERVGPGWALLVEGDSPLQAHISRLFEPHRIFIDLPGALLPEEWEPLTWSGEHGVERVRVGRNRPDLVRVVVDTTTPMGFQVFRSPEEERIVVFMRPSSLAGKKIVLDPGHGGRDQGAIGVTGLKEAPVNLQLARLLGARLAADGAQVFWTRDTDVYIPLADRPAVANRIGADLFISIHNNSCPEHCTGSGTETYFLPTRWENQLLAASVQQELVRAIGLDDRGIKQRNLAVLRHAEVPAILVEVAFLSSPREERLLRDRGFLERAADGLYRGVRRYMADVTSDATSDFTEMDPAVVKTVTRLLAEGLAAAEYVMTEPSVPAKRPEAKEAPSLAGSPTGEGEQS